MHVQGLTPASDPDDERLPSSGRHDAAATPCTGRRRLLLLVLREQGRGRLRRDAHADAGAEAGRLACLVRV